MGLLERQRLGNHADLLAAQWIEAFPEPPLGAAVSAKPFFAASGGAACFRFRRRRCGWRLCADHEIHRYFRSASSFSTLIWPSGSTRPVTRIVRVSKTRPP